MHLSQRVISMAHAQMQRFSAGVEGQKIHQDSDYRKPIDNANMVSQGCT
jgi:hypothetical protein